MLHDIWPEQKWPTVSSSFKRETHRDTYRLRQIYAALSVADPAVLTETHTDTQSHRQRYRQTYRLRETYIVLSVADPAVLTQLTTPTVSTLVSSRQVMRLQTECVKRLTAHTAVQQLHTTHKHSFMSQLVHHRAFQVQYADLSMKSSTLKLQTKHWVTK